MALPDVTPNVKRIASVEMAWNEDDYPPPLRPTLARLVERRARASFIEILGGECIPNPNDGKFLCSFVLPAFTIQHDNQGFEITGVKIHLAGIRFTSEILRESKEKFIRGKPTTPSVPLPFAIAEMTPLEEAKK